MVLTLNAYQYLSKRTIPASDKQGLTNYALGLLCESGEFGDHIKKHVFHGHELNRTYTLDELGDILHYHAGLATMLGFTLEEVANHNLKKLETRYPNGFNVEDSKKRVDVKRND